MRNLLVVLIGVSALVLLVAILIAQQNSGFIGTLVWPTQINQTDIVDIHDLQPEVNATRSDDQ